jgi:hypothetical protein
MAILASRFSNPTNYRSDRPLTESELLQYAPSVFATSAAEDRSARYTYIPTIEVVKGLKNEGFEVFSASQTRVRDANRKDFTKHMLRLRRPDQVQAQEANEVILLNSHDGTSSYQLLAGCFRFVCCNGLIVGDTAMDFRARHSGNVVDNVIEGVYSVVEGFDRVDASKDTMKSITLSEPQQAAFARAALSLKYEPEKAPIDPMQLLRPRRRDDMHDDLWSTFNRVQENLLRGGLRGRNASGKRATTRAVGGVNENVRLNRALWTLADAMTQLA